MSNTIETKYSTTITVVKGGKVVAEEKDNNGNKGGSK